MKQRVRLTISGRVQGVGYRMSAAEEAEALGLVGCVRNLDSGAVEIIAEGDTDSIAELIAWCHHGPPMAEVSRVLVTRSRAEGNLGSGFSIAP